MPSRVRRKSKKSTKQKKQPCSPHLKKGLKSPRTPSSIPTKYQTVFIAESEEKGFNSGSLRFSQSQNQNENPGPASYDVAKDRKNASLSRKGIGGLASKTPRSTLFMANQTPAPNSYKINSGMFGKHDFNRANTSTFHQPIATKVEDPKHLTPAPNKYNASIKYCLANNNVSAQAAFSSRTKREGVQLNHLKGPSPCHYKVKDSFTKESPMVLMSVFKSTTARDSLNGAVNNPGPASYDPFGCHEKGTKKVSPRKHYLNFSAPAVPVPKPTDFPGPGHYELVKYEESPKQNVSNSGFLSSTSRWIGSESNVPGPASYNPARSARQSFIFNNEKKWIPA